MTSCDPCSPCVTLPCSWCVYAKMKHSLSASSFVHILMTLTLNNNFWTRGAKVPCHLHFWEWKFHIVFSVESESSRMRKFHLWKLSLSRAKVWGNESSSYCLVLDCGTYDGFCQYGGFCQFWSKFRLSYNKLVFKTSVSSMFVDHVAIFYQLVIVSVWREVAVLWVMLFVKHLIN